MTISHILQLSGTKRCTWSYPRYRALDMYERFKRTGWTRTLARQTANELLPTIIRAVTLAWYDCIMESRS